jgi:tRNA threonylcarbamoyladenosine biosynthesis protein TsaE
MSHQPYTFSQNDIPEVARMLNELTLPVNILCFVGTLGAGKTSLIKEVLRLNGIDEEIQSPTFTYVNRYTNAQGLTFFHFDLYRMKNQDEFIDAGFEEMLDMPDSWSFIEWPEVIFPLLKKRKIAIIALQHCDPETRLITFKISSPH